MTKKMAYECLVCGTALEGPLGRLFHVFGITRSTHNPNVCNRCDAHMQEGRVIELSVIFADLTDFTEMTNRLGPERSGGHIFQDGQRGLDQERCLHR